MGKRCKVLIVAIMIAAIAVTGGIVSLGSANADNEILDTTRYVTVSGATVTAAQDLTAEGSGNIHKGLLISPETTGGTYSGKINGIFAQGSTTIQFRRRERAIRQRQRRFTSSLSIRTIRLIISPSSTRKTAGTPARRWETTKVIIVLRNTIIPKIFSKKKRNTAVIRRITVSFIRGRGKKIRR